MTKKKKQPQWCGQEVKAENMYHLLLKRVSFSVLSINDHDNIPQALTPHGVYGNLFFVLPIRGIIF